MKIIGMIQSLPDGTWSCGIYRVEAIKNTTRYWIRNTASGEFVQAQGWQAVLTYLQAMVRD